MSFREFNKKLAEHVHQISEGKKHLFNVDVTKDEMWQMYLDSWPAGTNEIFRERREHDCSCCRHFIRDLGNVVAINADNTVSTIWDLSIRNLDSIYKELRRQQKIDEEDSLLDDSRESSVLDLKISIIKHIVATKQAEATAMQDKVLNEVKKQKLLDVIERKQNAALEDLSVEELQKMASEL